MEGGKRTHFHRPDPRASPDIEDPLGIRYRSEKQPTLVHELEHMMLHIQTVEFLLIVWVEICCGQSVSLSYADFFRSFKSAYRPHDIYDIVFHARWDNPSH